MNGQKIGLLVLVVSVSFGYCLSGWAQEEAAEAISTERPTAGYSADVIPVHSLQVENGFGINLQRHSYTADLPESFLRYGLTRRIELRYTASNLMATSAVHQAGLAMQGADMGSSMKILVSGANRVTPKTIVLGLSAPTGGKSCTSSTYDPNAAAIWTQTNSKGYFLNELAAANLTTLNGARRPVWVPSVAGGKSLSSVLSVFGEYAPSVLTDRTVTHLVDGGFALVRHGNTQFDFRLGWLHDATGDHAILGVGYSTRRDNLFKRSF